MVDVEIYSLDTRMYNVIISTYCLRKRKDIIASDYSPLEPDWKKNYYDQSSERLASLSIMGGYIDSSLATFRTS